jgi:quercetin dioxygenase-like cupin family protein
MQLLPIILMLTRAAIAAPATQQPQAAVPPGFVEVRPADVRWTPNSSSAGGEGAILLGDPATPAPFVLRLRLPAGARVQPHRHPEARTYTVISGEWKIGFGERFDPAALRSYPAGSVFRLPARVAHFQATDTPDTVVQIEAIGPTGTIYVDPTHGPSRK